MRKNLIATSAVLLTAMLVPSGAGAGEASSHRAESGGVRNYWTPARMRAALPREVPATAVAGLPVETDRGRARVVEPSPTHRTGINRTEITDPSGYPNRVHGKVFFTLPGLGDFVCSGTVVNTPGRSVVVTAGHCVHDRSVGFATKFMFVPAYNEGDKPYGEWTAKRLASTDRWVSNEDLRYDVGMAVLRRDANGRGIQTVVGGRGIAFNQDRDQFYRSYGYPAAGEFDGQSLHRCDSSLGGNDSSVGSPATMFIHCDFTGGSSGGGWVIRDRFVVGLNSYKYDDDLPPVLPGEEPDHMYGPYFGDTILDLYRSVRGQKTRCFGEPVTHLGGRGDDTIVGTPGPDVIHTRGGNDTITGLAGEDLICAGAGDDVVAGNAGRDRIKGGRGRDLLKGGKGKRDVCVGGAGRDRARACETRRKIP